MNESTYSQCDEDIDLYNKQYNLNRHKLQHKENIDSQINMNSNKVRVVFDYDEKEDDDDDSCLVVIPNYERHERQKIKYNSSDVSIKPINYRRNSKTFEPPSVIQLSALQDSISSSKPMKETKVDGRRSSWQASNSIQSFEPRNPNRRRNTINLPMVLEDNRRPSNHSIHSRDLSYASSSDEETKATINTLNESLRGRKKSGVMSVISGVRSVLTNDTFNLKSRFTRNNKAFNFDEDNHTVLLTVDSKQRKYSDSSTAKENNRDHQSCVSGLTNNEPFLIDDPWLEHCRDPSRKIRQSNIKKTNSRRGKSMDLIKNCDILKFTPNASDEISVVEYKSDSIPRPTRRNSIIANAGCSLGQMKTDYMQFCSRNQIDCEKTIGKTEAHLPTTIGIPNHLYVIIQRLPGNYCCCDCGIDSGVTGLKWACVTYGIMLCDTCAYRHITNHNEMKSCTTIKCMKTGSWTFPDVISMLEGGNTKIIQHMNNKKNRLLLIRNNKRRSSLLGTENPEENEDSELNQAFIHAYSDKSIILYRHTLGQKVLSIIKAT